MNLNPLSWSWIDRLNVNNPPSIEYRLAICRNNPTTDNELVFWLNVLL